jgi:hypothetical protein
MAAAAEAVARRELAGAAVRGAGGAEESGIHGQKVETGAEQEREGGHAPQR